MNITFWLLTVLWMVIGLGLVGVGATVVRKAHPTAGYVLAGAGAVAILGTCCLVGIDVGTDPFDRTMSVVITFVAWGRIVLLAVLAATSLAMLANKLKQHTRSS